ncbi:hypothetical protein R3I93_006698 [Phoxinus phoxinus]|uniref:Uncharacterized protein n=1 Tax=Phoxinus phoxinus TaxID=58324 RepID=A0AAN9D5Y7_9TELE
MDPGGEAPSSSPTTASADIIPSHGKKRSIGSASKHQTIMFKAKADVEWIQRDIQVGRKISNADMTLYRHRRRLGMSEYSIICICIC